MVKSGLMVAALVLIAAPAVAQECLHESAERAEDRQRREQAVRVARELNVQQAAAVASGPTARYKRLSEMTLPEIPNGFAITLHTNGRTTYMFSLKDFNDPCYFALFSDQDGHVYTSHPQPNPDELPVR
jgi:hypothetical protein